MVSNAAASVRATFGWTTILACSSSKASQTWPSQAKTLNSWDIVDTYGAPEVGVLEVGVLEVGAPEVGAPEVGAPEVGVLEVGAPCNENRDFAIISQPPGRTR